MAKGKNEDVNDVHCIEKLNINKASDKNIRIFRRFLLLNCNGLIRMLPKLRRERLVSR